MSNITNIIDILNRSANTFYHFTDTRNLSSIRREGLISMRTQRERGCLAIAPGGNDWSFKADVQNGMDGYVHLCFFSDHPMEWIAKKDGRIADSIFLKIAPEVLSIPGVLIVDVVSNKSGAQPRATEEMIAVLDLKVIYTRTDWKDPAVQERLKIAKKYEILIPSHIPSNLIRNLPNG